MFEKISELVNYLFENKESWALSEVEKKYKDILPKAKEEIVIQWLMMLLELYIKFAGFKLGQRSVEYKDVVNTCWATANAEHETRPDLLAAHLGKKRKSIETVAVAEIKKPAKEKEKIA